MRINKFEHLHHDKDSKRDAEKESPLFQRDWTDVEKILHDRRIHREDVNALCRNYPDDEKRVCPERDFENRPVF